MSALDRPDLAEDARFATVALRLANRDACWAEVRPIFATATSAEWMARLEAASAPAGPIYRMDELFADPQVIHTGIAQTVEHPTRGPIRLVGQPVGLSRTPAAIGRPGPYTGEHADAVLAEAGYAAEEIAALRAAGAV